VVAQDGPGRRKPFAWHLKWLLQFITGEARWDGQGCSGLRHPAGHLQGFRLRYELGPIPVTAKVPAVEIG
jgi:hypothetical protein